MLAQRQTEETQTRAQERPDRRRPDLHRSGVTLPARLLRDGSPELAVLVRNLSAAGFMAECLASLEPGSKVVLALAGVGYIPAEIRWRSSFRIGAQFHYELSTRELGLAGS